MRRLSLYISPCPNDTFAFDAIINGRIKNTVAEFSTEYHDIEELNCAVLAGVPDICKISYSVYPKIAYRYALLDSGSALGRGNGQLLVRRKSESGAIKSVITPGVNTTAHALLLRYFPDVQTSSMLFSDIAEAVERGDADAGVLIHEGRFVYERRDLELVADLGQLWERETSMPLPLGAIVIKRELGEELQHNFEKLLSDSVRFAFDNPQLSRNFVKEHAQELEDEVIDKHISLFVNKFTISLGDEGWAAVTRLTGIQSPQKG